MELQHYRKQIEAALEYAGGSHSFEDVVAAVDADKAQFWPMPSSVVITEIVNNPRKPTLHFWLAGGVLEELQRAYPLIEQWGREKGCVAASMTGRLGWQRSFLTKEEGWRVVPLAIYEKPLECQNSEAKFVTNVVPRTGMSTQMEDGVVGSVTALERTR